MLKDNWERIYNHSTCRDIREKNGLPVECKDCDLLNVCGGGCPLSWNSNDYICKNV